MCNRKGEVSSAISLGFKLKYSNKSLTYFKKKRSPRIDPCGTLAEIFDT